MEGVEGRPVHEEGVQVVGDAVVTARSIEVVLRQQRQRPVTPGGEGGRLVHVVPEAIDPHVEQPSILPTPPCAGRRGCEIRVVDRAGPDDSAQRRAVRKPAEDALGEGLGKEWPILVDADPRIKDADKAGAEPSQQTVTEVLQARKPVRVHGEHPVGVHVVNVEVQGTQREIMFFEAIDDGVDLPL